MLMTHAQMMSRGIDCSEFFADVVKNVASPTLEIKKLVYIYLLRYAESEPDLALLSINTIQKALNDQNQVVRAMAIRVMSGIRVPVISQIVALAIKKGVTDMSAYVRKCAALAIPKCYKLDPTTMPQLADHLRTLLGDRSYYVVGAAVMAFLETCPERYDLIHPQYRNLVRMMIDMDEWGQLAVLRLLVGYARMSFPMEKKPVEKEKAKEHISSGSGAVEFYSGEEGGRTRMDADLELFLRACPPLLQSRNSAVREQWRSSPACLADNKRHRSSSLWHEHTDISLLLTILRNLLAHWSVCCAPRSTSSISHSSISFPSPSTTHNHFRRSRRISSSNTWIRRTSGDSNWKR